MAYNTGSTLVEDVRNLYEVPEDVLHKEGIEFLPTTLKDALDHFEADEVVRGALGAEYAEMYIRAKRRSGTRITARSHSGNSITTSPCTNEWPCSRYPPTPLTLSYRSRLVSGCRGLRPVVSTGS